MTQSEHTPSSIVPPRERLILASTSPRRQELLREAGYAFEVVPPPEDVECGICSEGGPASLVAELALRKAASVARMLAGTACARESPSLDPAADGLAIVVAADTVAECDGLVLGKPRDEYDARRMLERLSGQEHRVLSGVCLWAMARVEPLVRVDVTRLVMDPLSRAQIEDYLASGQWEGKAGAFGYQDRLGWIHIVEGSESNVVGLPLELLEEMLAEVRERINAASG